jgi:hypothetical protein
MVLTLAQVNNFEPGRSDKWDVRFRTGQGPSGYTDWIPATQLTHPIFNISGYDWSSGNRTLSLPKALDYPDMSMTLLDDDKRTIKKFLREWYEKVFPSSGGNAYLSDIVKVIEISPLTAQNEVVETESYIVYPTGSCANSLTSDASNLSYPVNFKIVGYSRR